MGEYAIRKSDGATIKIGTLENMYYLRYQDKNDVKLISGNYFGTNWRIPFTDEDPILPGNYLQHDRGLPLNGYHSKELANNPGQTSIVSKDNGIMITMKCYHGEKLPASTDEVKFSFPTIGKTDYYQISMIKHFCGKIEPIIKCSLCNKLWLAEWSEIIQFVSDEGMVERFKQLYQI